MGLGCNSLINLASRFARDTSGHIGTLFALLAIPLMLAMSFALDYGNAEREREQMKAALDAAVIAAINKNNLKPSEREKFAEAYFTDNYQTDEDIKLTSTSTDSRVDLIANSVSPVTLGRAIGTENMKISAHSAAEIASENTICVLALAPKGNGITFRGSLRFNAPTCSVQSNSTDSSAISSTASNAPVSKSFCAAGGVKGDYEPYGKGDCETIEDPYINVPSAPIGACDLGTGGSGDGSPGGSFELRTTFASVGLGLDGGGRSLNRTGSNVTMPPGTYCGGLTIDGRNVTFLPGDYVMLDGPLTLTNGAEATGDGVTFSFEGDQSTLLIEEGASANLKAPSSGPRAGLAFMQGSGRFGPGNRKMPEGMNFVRSGGSLKVTGTLYFPTQVINVQGNGTNIGANAPATSFIGYQVNFRGAGDARVNIAVDHVAAGLPPILPRAADGARLVK
ncbi:TadE/TadG family type IV pilus assembly protein [Litorimonas sp. RW-G-Af-16]|uniref:TadE/TadG family type IV pilus assembly protein n=1 Tax=Litorimonas sp. RW-G-Af-16 TaxID=3241168 RepID=UPI00390C528B